MSIRFYCKCISPFSRPHCCFYPSCSSYAIIAIQRHGVLLGACLTVWRVLRCNPWSCGGYDPVPEKIKFIGGDHG